MRHVKAIVRSALTAGFLATMLSSVFQAEETASGQLNRIVASVLAAYGGEQEVASRTVWSIMPAI